MMSRKMFNALRWWLCITAMPVLAQSEQLQARRAAMEQAYQQDMAVCYQRFDVVSCRNAAREKRIETNAALRKDELAHNASERQRAAQEAQSRADEKQRDAQVKAVEAATRETTPNNPPKPQPINDNSQRAAYEQKQREAAERRSSIDKRLRERDKPPAAPLPLPEAAK
jgi:colicin import membrane protein